MPMRISVVVSIAAVASSIVLSLSIAAADKPDAATNPTSKTAPPTSSSSSPATAPAQIAKLILQLQDSDPKARIAAAQELAKLRAIEALGPLIHLAARDNDPAVRDAAAEAVTWLGPEPESRINLIVRKRLMERLPKLDIQDKEGHDVLISFGETAALSLRGHWGQVDPRTKVTIHATNITMAEAYCRLFSQIDDSVGFILGTDSPIYFSLIPVLTSEVLGYRAQEAYRHELNQWAAKHQDGAETLRKLQTHFPKEEATAKDALNSLAQAAEVEIQVDWDALKEQGITDDQKIHLGSPYEKGSLPYDEPVEKAIWWVLHGLERDSDKLSPSPIEYIVDGTVIRVSTHDKIQAYIKAHPATATAPTSSPKPETRRPEPKTRFPNPAR